MSEPMEEKIKLMSEVMGAVSKTCKDFCLELEALQQTGVSASVPTAAGEWKITADFTPTVQ